MVGIFRSSRTKKERRSSPVIELRSRGPTSWSSVRRADGGRREEWGRKMISRKNKLTDIEVKLMENMLNFLIEIILVFTVVPL